MRRVTFFISVAAMAAFAALGPGAAPAAASGGAPIIEETILEDHHVADEGDGVLVEFDLDGVARTTTFPDGRVIYEQETTLRAITTQYGVVISDSTSTSTLFVIAQGEETFMNRARTYGETQINGQTCVNEFSYLFVNGREVVNEVTGPICS